MLDFNTQAAAVAFGINTFLFFYVLLNKRGWSSLLNRTFAILILMYAAWNAGNALDNPLLFYSGLFLIAPSLHTFLIVFLRKRGHRERQINRILWGLGILLIVIFAYTGFHRTTCGLTALTLITPVGIWGGYYIFRRIQNNASRQERMRFAYVFAGLIAAALGGIASFFQFHRIPVLSVSTLGSLACTIFIAIAITRHRLIDIGRLASRTFIVTVFTLIFWFLIGILGNWSLNPPVAPLFSILIASMILVFLYEPLSRSLESQADRMLSRERYRFSLQVENFSQRMSSLLSEPELLKALTQMLRNSDLIGSFGIYLVDANNRLFIRDGEDIRKPRGSEIEHPNILEEMMIYRRRPISRAEIAQDLRSGLPAVIRRHRIALYRDLTRLRAQVAFPIIFAEQFLGFLTLGFTDEEAGITLREETALIAVIRQFSAGLAHARLIQREKTRDRLASMGQLASGLAHEIRNPLATIKAAVQYLQPGDSDHRPSEKAAGQPDADAEFHAIIRDEVDRLNRFVERFLNFARPGLSDPSTNAEPIDQLIHRVLLLYRTRSDVTGVIFESDIDPEAERVSISLDAGMQILTNLIDNAIQAIGGAGTIRIGALRREGSDRLELAVEDSGPGISETDFDRVLQPFYTTRETGTGLGLAIVQQLVQALGLELAIGQSDLGGARFSVLFMINPQIEPSRDPFSSRMSVSEDSNESGKED
ncbi:hypothetical protein JXA40_02700 [bacterium]|nr:hypothetical protein [candidate division CSSED10-310 bacterium]